MANDENLKPWQAGQSGNPAGKPKGTRNRATVIREILEQAAVDAFSPQLSTYFEAHPEQKPKTIQDQMALAIAVKALHGDVAAFKELMDGVHGKLTENVKTEHSFTQMGKAIVKPNGDGKQPQQIGFEVGEEAGNPDSEDGN